MVGHEYFDLFWQDSVDKQWRIGYRGGVITNNELFSQSIEITESLCSSKELKFGSCEASSMKFKVADIVQPLAGEWLTVTVVLNGDKGKPVYVGRYKVVSDKPTADRLHREIVAYDIMYDILNADVTGWYNATLPDKDSQLYLHNFFSSFMKFFGLPWDISGMANGNMVVRRTIDPEKLSGKDVITSICEVGGCFGHIRRNGYTFKCIQLAKDVPGVYPAEDLFPSPNLYPQGEQKSDSTLIGEGIYINCQYEDFTVKKIDRLQIRNGEGDIGQVYPEGEREPGENCYVIEGNFLLYGKTAWELKGIAENIFTNISDIPYRPFSCEAMGNPCLEVGDMVRIPTKYKLVKGYILSRTLKGLQALRDTYKADGAEQYSGNVNGIQNSIIQLTGRTNTLKRTVDETVSEIYSFDEDGERYSRITQNADKVEIMSGDGYVSSKISVEKELVSIKGNRFELESDNLRIDRDGNVDISGNAVIKGDITARKVLNMTYVNTASHPNIERDFTFLKTGGNQSDGFGGSVLLCTPDGKTAIEIGNIFFSDDTSKFGTPELAYFPNGAAVDKAYIKSLMQAYFDSGYITELSNNHRNQLAFRIRKSGVFVSLYGTFRVYLLGQNKRSEFNISGYKDMEFLPTHHSPRAVGYAGNRVFVFQLSTDGHIYAWNTGDALDSADPISVNYRFDYFIF